MGIAYVSNLFQNEIVTLMKKLEFVRVYIDNLLVITTGSFETHLERLDKNLEKFMKAGLKAKHTENVRSLL